MKILQEEALAVMSLLRVRSLPRATSFITCHESSVEVTTIDGAVSYPKCSRCSISIYFNTLGDFIPYGANEASQRKHCMGRKTPAEKV